MTALSPLMIKLLTGAALVAIAVGGVMYVRALRAEKDALTAELTSVKHDVQTRDATISGLKSHDATLGEQQQKLDRTTNNVEAASSSVRQQIRKAVYENATGRAWADTPLPDDVVRLSASPTLTGAGDFGAGVSAAVAVSAASAVAAN
ncbi:protein lysB [Burkholderia plantarii]|uniref:protein lysB n=1 Tax=Burkholderia plantarii TaxID=41899 RepID=UPI00272CCDBB|nr:protein lysB [Burkholderia plantarii]